ncbi:TIGR00366 family protein [Belliella baltica]|uniref:TIGR00366 family protein n=1 Tax=Belliella baltica TaxID=232259 RepID=UPI00031F4A24|nr:TIGR00366 family protein [Belliella baltica]
MDKSKQVNLSPTFVVALLLSLIVFLSAVIFTQPDSSLDLLYAFDVLKFWQKGFWELLEFTLQMVLILGISDFFQTPQSLGFIDLNYVNFMLLGAGLLAYQSLTSFIKSVTIALSGSVEIILQFPFYAGILGMMKYSGLLSIFSESMVNISSPETFPLLSFLSAAMVNFFIPSGGGQWAIQGPIIMDAANQLGLNQAKMVMVFSYGDQLSNMLQPFWALPLLAITGVPAKEILKYTAYFFLIGLLVFGLGIYFLF